LNVGIRAFKDASMKTLLTMFLLATVGCREQSVAVRAEPSARHEAAVDPPPAPRAFDACRAIVMLDLRDDVLAFTPDPPVITKVSHAACPIDIRESRPHSIAVEDDGTIWAGVPDGRVVKIRARDGSCEVTALAPHQAGFDSLNLTFVGSTLWASDDHGWGGDVKPSLGLARVDRAKLTLTPVGNPAYQSRMILAGTADGTLYAEPPVNIDRIDLTQAKPTAKELTPFEEFAKADGVPMAYFHGAIYLFDVPMPAFEGDVVRYDLAKKTYTVMLPPTRQYQYVAAGASMCASR
jgi:hypothetical protein